MGSALGHDRIAIEEVNPWDDYARYCLGAEIVTTEMVVFEWLRTADHPKFQDAVVLIK